MLPYIAEFVGTMLLILLGDGVVANVNLKKSGMNGAGPIQITIAWGLAVMVPAFIFGEASGASFNPARDLGPRVAHAVLPIKGKGDNDWSYGLTVPVIGPIIGAIIAVLLYNVIF